MFIMPPVFNAGDTVYFFFDTYDSNGASVTITGLAVTDIEVYKNGSVTQRSSDSGYALLDTDGIDFDGTVGLHGFSIDTSDNTDAGFWADGAQYLVNVNAITVDSQTVRFSYMLTLGYLLRPTTAGRKLDVSSGGEAGIDWANIGSPTTTVGLSGTTVKTATDVETDTADIQSRLPAALISGRIDASVGAMAANTVTASAIADGAIDAATFAADVDAEILSYLVDDATRIDASSLNTATVTTIPAIVADTNELQTDWTNGGRLDLIIDAILVDTAEIGAAGAGLTEAGGTGDQFTAIPWNAAWDVEVQSEVQDAIEANNLDHLMKVAVDTDFPTTVHNDSALAYLAHDGIGTGGLFDRTTDSLEAIRNRGDSDWITATGFSTHSASDVWSVGTRTLTSGTNIDGSTFTAIPWNAAWDAEVQSECSDALTAINLDHLLSSGVDTDFDTTVHTDSVIGYLAHNGVGTDGGYDRATDSLEALYDAIQAIDVGTGSGGTDWTSAERTAIRSILGFDGSGNVTDPSTGILDTIRDDILALDFSTFDPTTDKVTLADGVTHGGTTAKLRLGAASSTDPALHVTNSVGTAVLFNASGTTVGHGLHLSGGTGAAGARLTGGNSGLQCIASNNGSGVYFQASGSGNVIDGFTSGTGDYWNQNFTEQIRAGLSTLTSAQVNTEVDTALADINLDHLVKIAVDTDFATTVHSDSIIGQIAHNGIGTDGGFDRTTDSLEAIRDRGDNSWITATVPPIPSAASIADAVYDEARTGHNTSGTFGETLTSLNARLPGSGTISTLSSGDIPTASQNATAILAAGDVDGYTLEETLKLCLAALAGKLSGAATTTVTIRAADDSKARITATVDADGNRSAVTLDVAG